MTRPVVLVTGAGQGLGAAICRGFHAAGYGVAITDVDAAAAAKLAEQLDPSGETAQSFPLDVRSREAFERVLEALCARWGKVEALVNNAAVTKATPVLDISPDEFDAVIAVNLKGTFLGCQVFGRYFKEVGYGRIVNVASLAGQNGGTATGAHYAASKGGVLTLTKVFARDLAPYGVTVNAVAPGPLDVPSIHEVVSAEVLAKVVSTIPAGALGDPATIARIVIQLAAREMSFVTGAVWDMNGGLFMR